MKIAVAIIQALLIILVPLLIQKYKNCKLVKLAGTTGVAYLFGLLIALIRYLLSLAGVDIPLSSAVSEYGSHVAIAIAIPLLLFCTNLKAIKKLSKPTIIAFGTLIVTVLVVTVGAFFIFRGVMDEAYGQAGMAVGICIGGTPNLNSVGAALGLTTNTISFATIGQMLVGGVVYVFLLFAAKPLLSKILKGKNASSSDISNEEMVANVDNLEDIKKAPKKPLIVAFFISLGCAIVSAGIGLAIWAILGCKPGTMTTYLVPALLIGVTVFGIIGSFNTKLRNIKGQNTLGNYFILVFSFAISMSIDFSQITVNTLYIMLFYLFIMAAVFIVQVIICKIFKIDADICITTYSAGIYGPAFIPSITKQLKNDNVTSAGLICGSLGYAVGTFLGLAVAGLLVLI